MKKLLLLAAVALIGFSGPVHADDKDMAYKGFNEFPVLTAGSIDAVNDYIPVWDVSTRLVKKTPVASFGANAFEDVTATNVLTTAECGKTMSLNSTTEFVTTLPAPTAGCSFKFIVKSAPSLSLIHI